MQLKPQKASSSTPTELKEANTNLRPNTAAIIFLIDDEPLILELYRLYLTQAGYRQLHCFSNPVEALRSLEAATPNLILTDLQMPQICGQVLIERIRTLHHLRDVPVIAVTSDESAEVRNEVLQRGANAIAYKPMDASKIVDSVRRGLASVHESPNAVKRASSANENILRRKAVARLSELSR